MSDKYGLQTSDDWYSEHADEVIDGGISDPDKGELEGLAPFVFVVALLVVAFVLDCLF